RNFRELEIWKRSFELVTEVYLLTKSFPDSEKFGLITQIRRSAVSIPSNISEGCGRGSTRELIRFLNIALGSAFELETQLLLSARLSLGDSADIEKCLEELNQIQKMINGFIKSIAVSN